MNYVNIQHLQNLLQQYTDIEKLRSTFFEIINICHIEVKYTEPNYALAAAKNINKRVMLTNKFKDDPNAQISWQFGQFKIFVWIVIYKSLIKKLQIPSFTDQIIGQICSILHSKALQFIKYQIKVLSSYFEPYSESWEAQEIKMLTNIIETHFLKKQIEHVNWRYVSYSIFTESNYKFFKNPNHCREKWNNHLNPTLKKGKWTIEQDVKLFTLIEKYGFRWAKISKCMDNTRTEHMVKNRYNYFLRINKDKIFAKDPSIITQFLKKKLKASTLPIENNEKPIKTEENVNNQHDNMNSSGSNQEEIKVKTEISVDIDHKISQDEGDIRVKLQDIYENQVCLTKIDASIQRSQKVEKQEPFLTTFYIFPKEEAPLQMQQY